MRSMCEICLDPDLNHVQKAINEVTEEFKYNGLFGDIKK